MLALSWWGWTGIAGAALVAGVTLLYVAAMSRRTSVRLELVSSTCGGRRPTSP